MNRSASSRVTFDFENIPNKHLRKTIFKDPEYTSKLAYKLKPGKHVLIGTGIATAIPRYMLMWLLPRSGLSMSRLTLTNAPGTIDPDYRGEPGALLVNQSKNTFYCNMILELPR